MFTLRPAAERGVTKIDWLDSRHSFSFGEYFDPNHHHFRALRVINDDRIAPGSGFGTHPHRDMEILSYAVNGGLAHRDSLGHTATIHTGQWQYMSAGSGILHSEFNPSQTEGSRFLQIWIVPNAKGLAPRYAERPAQAKSRASWELVASLDGRDDSIAIRQDVNILHAKLQPGDQIPYSFSTGRAGWLQIVSGSAVVNEMPLQEGDGLKIEEEPNLHLTAKSELDVILFDLV